MLLDLVEVGRHIAPLKAALMLRSLDHCESKQALALTHGNPAGGAVWLSLPVREFRKQITELHTLSLIKGG